MTIIYCTYREIVLKALSPSYCNTDEIYLVPGSFWQAWHLLARRLFRHLLHTLHALSLKWQVDVPLYKLHFNG